MTAEYRYLDILWLDNLVMNFVLLWVTWKMAKNQSAFWRLWLSAAIGAFYAAALFIPGFHILQSLPLKIALSLIMLLTAYQVHTFRDFFKLLGFFYGATFVFGGAAMGLYYMASDTIYIRNGVFYIENYPVKTLIFASIIVIILSRSVWTLIKTRLSHETLLYNLEIEIDRKKVLVDALLDTGNALCDPISHQPVIVVEFKRIMDILPSEIQSIFEHSCENNLEYITQVVANSSWIGRFRMIPFTALGKPNGMLIGFKADRVKVLMGEDWRELRGNIIGIYNQSLSRDSQYQALMNPEIIH